MRSTMRWVLLAAAAASLGGCAAFPLSGDDPYPVYGNPVNPTPAPGYRVRCNTVPGIANVLFDDYYSGCHSYIGPDGQLVVVQARG